MIFVRHVLAEKRVIWIGLLLLTLTGVALMIYITPNGMGLVNDSVGYIGGARNILAGNGYSRLTGDGTVVPVTNYPPMLSIILAGLGFFGLDAIQAIWWLNVVLFGANIFVTGLVVYRITGSALFAWLSALVFCGSSPLFQIHSFAMTEPLYLFLSYLVLILLAAYMKKPSWALLILGGVLSGLAFLTRYVAISLYATFCIVLLLFLPILKERFNSILIFLAAGLPLPVAWAVRNMLVSENAANRQFALHPLPADKIGEGLRNFWGWLLPERGGLVEGLLTLWTIVFVILLVVLLCIVIWGALRVRSESQSGNDFLRNPLHNFGFVFSWIFALQALSYLCVLWLSLTFVDASPILEHRILSPFYVSLLVLGMVALTWVWQRKTFLAKICVVLLLAGFLLSLAEDSLDIARDLHKEGQGFAASLWRESETIQALKTLPKNNIFVSNKATAIYILTGHPAFILPSPINPATGQPRENYREDVDTIRQLALDGKGWVVVFDYEELLKEGEGQTWMEDIATGLPQYGKYQDGVIFGVRP